MGDELGKRERPKRGAETYAKLKFDRQIVAIAKVVGGTQIYSDDHGLKKVAERAGIDVVRLQDLPLPPEELQGNFLEELEDNPKEEPPPSEEDGDPGAPE